MNNYVDININLWYPIASTFILVTFMPLLANGAKWVSAFYEVWIRKALNKLEGQTPLSIEESNQLRFAIEEEKRNFQTVIISKDNQLAELNAVRIDLSGKVSVLEREKLEKENDNQKKLKILRAEYGINGKFFDVTDRLNSLMRNDSITLKADPNMLGDPAPGIPKQLSVIYRNHGKYEHRVLQEGKEYMIIDDEKNEAIINANNSIINP